MEVLRERVGLNKKNAGLNGPRDFSPEADGDCGNVWALDGGIEAFREGVMPAERCARSGSYCWSSVSLAGQNVCQKRICRARGYRVGDLAAEH